MDSGLGQQTYGHPHHVGGGWIPHHMLSVDHNIVSQSQAHHMFTVTQQPVSHIYYDAEQTGLQPTTHNIGNHHPLAEQHQAQAVDQQQPIGLAVSQHQIQTTPSSAANAESDSLFSTKSFSPTESSNQNAQDDSAASKNHTTPMTLKWLNDNYEVAEGVCIPRSTLYQHYIEFCEGHELNPVNAASFGKIIRQQFPQITTRRLGTRGQSKYHYYGIGVREQSQYYDLVYSKAGLQSPNSGKKETPKQAPIQAYSPRSKMGTLLPDFPSVEELKLPEDIEPDKLLTFIMMYRTHCQRILDTVIRANFDEVQNFLLHFWQGMPAHMTTILGASQIVGLVAVCDTILYKAVCSVLMPHILQPLPESLITVIKKFAKQLEDWIAVALNDLPESLRQMKLTMARKFSRILRLQMSLNHLCQASRSVVNSADVMSQMLDDWQAIDRQTIIKQTQLTLCQKDMIFELDKINQFYDEFEQLLQENVPIESFIEWLDKIIDESIVKTSDNETGSVKKKSQSFLLVWSAFSTKIIRDMTLHSAPSFGSFHLLQLMFDDYILYHLEHMCCTELSDEILSEIKGQPKVSSVRRDVLLPSSKCSSQHQDKLSTCHQDTIPTILAASAAPEPVLVSIQQHQTEFMTSSHVESLNHLTDSVTSTNQGAATDSGVAGDTGTSESAVGTLTETSNRPGALEPSGDESVLVSASSANNMNGLQVTVSQVSAHQVSAHQVSAHQIPAHQVSAHQVSAHQVPAHQVSAHQVSTSQVPNHQVSAYRDNSITYYMNDLATSEASWRLQDSIPPPPLQYHGDNYSLPVEQSNPDILYYAVNSLNLLPESNMAHSSSTTTATTTNSQNSRVTFDPEEVQQALDRSFQPYTHHLQYTTSVDKMSTSKRTAPGEHPDVQMSKRFLPDSNSSGSVANKESYVLT